MIIVNKTRSRSLTENWAADNFPQEMGRGLRVFLARWMDLMRLDGFLLSMVCWRTLKADGEILRNSVNKQSS